MESLPLHFIYLKKKIRNCNSTICLVKEVYKDAVRKLILGKGQYTKQLYFITSIDIPDYDLATF